MFEKNKYSLFNILLFCIALGMLFFVKVNSYADVVRDVDVTIYGQNGDSFSEYGYTSIYNTFTFPENVRSCLLLLDHSVTSDGVNVYEHSYFMLSEGGSYPNTVDTTWRPVGGSPSTQRNHYSRTFNDSLYSNCYTDLSINLGTNNFIVSENSSGTCPIFYDVEDARAYLTLGYIPTKPFDDSIKLDSFRVYSKGSPSSTVAGVHVAFDSIVVKPVWSNPEITDVEISIYAVNPEFNYNPRNYSYSSNESGILHTLDISGLTLHEQKFVVRATPYTSTNKGVSIAYELEFPNTFEQPLGDLVIREPNTYPYSTTLDISGNELPVYWTVSMTPIYIYETNNVENYYYGDEVSYPVLDPSVGDTYEETIINNYYNDYSSVVNNYSNSFDFNFGDISANDIETGYNNVGDFLNGIGSLISKLAQLLSGLFPFLNPLVSATLIGVIALVVVVGGIVLFIKLIRNLLP